MNDIKTPPFTDGEKEVIEATKRIANGKLICDVDDDIDVLTNEEYIRQCSTEQLVHFLIRLCSCGWLTKDKLDVFLNSTYFPVYNMEEIANLEEWLKEKHE